MPYVVKVGKQYSMGGHHHGWLTDDINRAKVWPTKSPPTNHIKYSLKNKYDEEPRIVEVEIKEI